MRTTIEISHRFDLGDIVYAIVDNKVVKGKITRISYSIETEIIDDTSNISVTYNMFDVNDKKSFWIKDNNKTIFKSKDDIIDFLKIQIDKITTDDYNQTFTANN